MKSFYLTSLLILIVTFSYAQWNTDSTQRNPICIQPHSQSLPLMCTDGHGGAIIAWEDERSGSEFDLYAQRIDTNGKVKWAANGIELSSPAGLSGIDEHFIVSDNAGGAIIFFEVSVIGGANHIYAQRIDSTGKELWSSGGVPISIINDSRMRDAEDAGSNQACSDGEGGAFITWQEYGPFANYVQHIDKNGNVLWGANGESITSTDSATARYQSAVVSTGGGTAAVAYSYYPRLYLQRINTNGAFMWGSAGVKVADSAYTNNAPNEYLVYDSISTVKSVMVTWQDIRTTPTNGSLYSQKLDLNGNIVWQKNGIKISSAPNAGDVNSPDMIIDKNGGFFVIYDSSLEGEIQHVNSSGQLLWGTGKNVSAISYAELPVITDDGEGGFIAAWHDNYFGQGIFTQHFDGNGKALWRTNGIPVVNDYEDINHSNNPIISAGNGSAIIAWADDRNVTITNDDIYAAKVGGTDGLLPVQFLSFTGKFINKSVQLNWSCAQQISTSYFIIERSADGRNFAPLTRITANNKINGTANYTTTDASPNNGKNYYRLKEVDADGRFVYSSVFYIDINDFITASVYPNPAGSHTTLYVNSSVAKKITVFLYNLNGELLSTQNAQIFAGDNDVHINLQNIAKGVYVIKSNDINFKQSIIVQ